MAGCTNNWCVIERKTGMTTNGRCTCLDCLLKMDRIALNKKLQTFELAYKLYVKLSNSETYYNEHNEVEGYCCTKELMNEFSKLFDPNHREL